jgi:hypothetical protein
MRDGAVRGPARALQAVFAEPSWPHLAAVGALALLVPVGLVTPALVLSAAARVVLVVLGAWETLPA